MAGRIYCSKPSKLWLQFIVIFMNMFWLFSSFMFHLAFFVSCCWLLPYNYGLWLMSCLAVNDASVVIYDVQSIAYDRSSAPKDCMVSAWFEEPGSDPSKRAEKTFILTKFSYDLEKSNAQTFKVETAISGIINIVRLDFSSNHGSSTLTCIYRFRVHGYEPNFTSKNTSE